MLGKALIKLALVTELDEAGFGTIQAHGDMVYGHTRDEKLARSMTNKGWEVLPDLHPDPNVWSVGKTIAN